MFKSPSNAALRNCRLLALAMVTTQPTLAAPAVEAPVLAQLDCKALKLDFVGMMPEMVTPKPLVVPDPPFTPTNLARLAQAGQLDPNGLCHYRDANRALAPASRNRVVFFGDSITEYWSIADQTLFSGDVINRGISGQTTGQMLLRFQHDVIALHPRVVHIMAGINDAMAPNGMLTTRANIISMVELAQQHNIKVILGSLTPADRFWLVPEVRLTPHVAEHNRWLREYAAEAHVAYVDYYTALGAPDGQMHAGLSNDTLHPNRLGYARMSPLAQYTLARLVNLKAARAAGSSSPIPVQE